MQRTPAARARGISKYFGDIVALDGVDLDVGPGQVHGLVGPNGAGKTTLLGLLLGLATADAGTLEILGRPVGRSLGVADGVAGFVDGPGLYPSLTARQNLTALAALRGSRPDVATTSTTLLERAGLIDVADVRVRGFSLGMRQRLGLAAALLTRPRLLVLDEPANGLDPAGKRHVHRVISRPGGRGRRGRPLQPPDGRPGRAVRRGDDARHGRVAFSGPVEKLAAESGELDYRLADLRQRPGPRSSPPARPTSACTDPDAAGPDSDALVVSGPVGSLDALVARLVGAGVAVRELAPVVSPLEAAFLALTGRPRRRATGRHDRHPQPGPTSRPGRHRCCPATRFELTKLLTQWRIRIVLLACLVAPGCFVAVVSSPDRRSRRTPSSAAGCTPPAGPGRWSCSPSRAAGCCRC